MLQLLHVHTNTWREVTSL